MKQLKRAAAVLLAVCLIFSLAACGGVNIDKTAKNLHIEQAENIRVWYCDDRYTDYLNFVADRFHSANELVTIEPVLVDSDNYLENIYEESVRNGNVADVYLMLTDELEKAKAECGKEDVVLVFGSLSYLGEVIRLERETNVFERKKEERTLW